MFIGSTHFRPWERIWKSWAPGKCKFFMWLAAHNRCWTADRLARKGLPHPECCPLCDQADETIDHLLVSCVFTQQIWFKLLRSVGLQILAPQPDETSFDDWWEKASERVSGQAEALREALCEKDVPSKVYVGMRYWHPFTEEAIEQIKHDGITKLVVLPLYPQFSISTSGSSLRLLESIFREDEYLVNMQHTVIPSWYQREGYIKAMATLIENELKNFPEPQKVMIFFSAHGVPLAYVEEAGDPYKAEMEECIDLIMEELEKRGITNPCTLAYQSRVGPVEWLKPYTDETIVELGQKGVKSLLAVPISFVSEHIETLEEIDVEYKELALKSGIEHWGRVPALGCEPTFISDLADAVIESLPYVGAMAVSNLEARQSLVPLGSVEELLAAYDSKRDELPPPVIVWEWGWTKSAETWNGRAAMLAVLVLLVLEVTTGEGFLHQWGILPLFH
ncbi:hypothetical protein PVAP13_1KG333200 [Panicum virgatum]|uniref:Ferrochelatase n=1 Tax=Panicum virgatum TaxID=38727 RepID=A0A8T0XPN6_PANVG|nr:hypothetical protein PVAP13_1KG333200 [Panicum virgatum]